MKFSDEKRRAIESYILDKVGSGDPELSQTVAAAFDINRNTAHKYISRLVDEGVIERRKRGEYALKKPSFHTASGAPRASLRAILRCSTNASSRI